MYRTQTVINIIITISLFFCSIFIAAGQSTDTESTDTEETTNINQSKSEENPAEKVGSELKDTLSIPKGFFARIKNKITSFIPDDEQSKNKDAFGVSTNADDKIRNFGIFAGVPLKFKFLNLSLNGKYSQTYHKNGLLSGMQNPSDSESQKAKWMFLSESYAFGLETHLTKKLFRYFTLGTQIDYQNGITPEIDPHLHTDIFTQFPIVPKWDWLKGAVGIWVAGQQLGTNSAMRNSGWHIHIDTNVKGFKMWYFNIMYINMMIEALPRWNFGEFRVVGSPEMVIKFKPFGDKFALVIHGEIEYYYKKTGFTFEPIIDVDPLNIRWTKLIRVPF